MEKIFLSSLRVKNVFLSVAHNLEVGFHTLLSTFLLKKVGDFCL